jgi:hypothetical protein
MSNMDSFSLWQWVKTKKLAEIVLCVVDVPIAVVRLILHVNQIYQHRLKGLYDIYWL